QFDVPGVGVLAQLDRQHPSELASSRDHDVADRLFLDPERTRDGVNIFRPAQDKDVVERLQTVLSPRDDGAAPAADGHDPVGDLRDGPGDLLKGTAYDGQTGVDPYADQLYPVLRQR